MNQLYIWVRVSSILGNIIDAGMINLSNNWKEKINLSKSKNATAQSTGCDLFVFCLAGALGNEVSLRLGLITK